MNGRVITFGEVMALVRSTKPGMLALTRDMQLGTGGAEGNFAVALKRLGADVTWIGRVGQDSFGQLVARELRAEGIDVHAITDPDAPTGLMVKESRTRKNTRVYYYRRDSAGSRLNPEDFPSMAFQGATLLHATGITPALSASAQAATLHAMEKARAAGMTVSFDLNFRSQLWSAEEAAIFYRKVLPMVDIVFAGDDEAALIVGENSGPAALASALADLGPTEVVIKLGDQGCYALIDGAAYTQKAIPVSVVDTVGAGDGFVAGYVADYLLGAPVQQRLLTAVSVGAFACMVPGDWEGMPFRPELDLLAAKEPVSR
ncbi:sugar kinase [Pseudarthrobacter oxydans]|uniref:sugar kinase n=1 Tax=Pseudarthrobacter oxydans TaxID=1671 RepID=UPI003808BD79